MTVGRDYLMKQPSRPSAPKVFLDTRVIPSAVNAAGSLEVALDRVAVRTGLRPVVILTGSAVAGLLVAWSMWRKRSTMSVTASNEPLLKASEWHPLNSGD
jgi:hypothetical protein